MFAESFSHGIKTFTSVAGVVMNTKLSTNVGVEKTVVLHGSVQVTSTKISLHTVP